jgi:hypothetical protein
MTLAERWTHWLIVSKARSDNPIDLATKHDEHLSDSIARRLRPAVWKADLSPPIDPQR